MKAYRNWLESEPNSNKSMLCSIVNQEHPSEVILGFLAQVGHHKILGLGHILVQLTQPQDLSEALHLEELQHQQALNYPFNIIHY